VTALELISYATEALYVLVFLVVGVQAIRRPDRASVDIALFFLVSAVLIIELELTALFGVSSSLVTATVVMLALALPYLLLRLVSDFAHVHWTFMRTAEAGLVAIALAYLLAPAPASPALSLAVAAYFVIVSGYCAVAFIRSARRSTGVTRRRMTAVAAGTMFLGADVVLAVLAEVVPEGIGPVLSAIAQLFGLASGLSYFVGFAPPRVLRRAWQEPELREFLHRAASLPRLPATSAIVDALQSGAANTLGGRAAIGLYDPGRQVLRFQDPQAVLPDEVGPSRFLVWRVFEAQRAGYFPDAARAHPELASVYRSAGVASLLIAPISAGDKRLGALEVYTDRPPIFSADDLSLTQLFADQAAVILESRALIDEAARVRAHEESARLKEDFLSAAAHDLKTPLTTLVAQAQFLERRAEQQPSAPADLSGIRRIVREARRLSALVVELLDAARLEQGRLIGEREPVDLVELTRDIVLRESFEGRRITVSAEAPVVGTCDPRRIGQVIENLVENAVKYSPEEGSIRVGIAQRNGHALIDVSDEGIGIPAHDLAQIFDRFHRASNVDDRRFAGMGLGLFICKGIVEQHGGRIWVESRVGAGSTFHVALPVEGQR
jgi:signal transduction histidine kinase